MLLGSKSNRQKPVKTTNQTATKTGGLAEADNNALNKNWQANSEIGDFRNRGENALD